MELTRGISRTGSALLLALLASAGPVSVAQAENGTTRSLPPLREVPQIDDNILWVAMAIEISDHCDSIAPRTLRGLAFLWKLKGEASDMGYTDAQIEAYVESKDEKARMRRRGDAYMRARGLNPESEADLCTLGHDEIERGSQIGVLLRAR